jgi:hypothetical protein
MDDHTKLDLEAALKVIEDLLREQLKTSGRLPETIVTVRGTALAALRIRERSDDVDLYMLRSRRTVQKTGSTSR